MTKINKKTRVSLSLLLTIILVLGSLTSFVYAENSSPKAEINTVKGSLKEEALNKIEKGVLEDLEEEEYVEILVYMKEQTDTEMIAQNIRNSVSSTMTPHKTKLTVRREVVEGLRDTAESTQVNILKYVEQEKKKGNVIEYRPYHIVNIIYVKATKKVIENISYMAEVEKIYKNKIHKLEKPIIKEEKNELANDDRLEWNIERVKADKVWDLGIDGTGAVVGIIDSGVDWTHPALKNRWRGYNPETGKTNPQGNWFDPVYDSTLPEDSGEHGSHVMGTAVGQELDGSNKVGVAPGAKWIAARVFDISGYTTDNYLLDAAEWMVAPGGNPDNAPDVINNSWGGGAGIDDWYRDAVNNWRAAEILPVFSAGNQRQGEPEPWPGSISCPANYPESFAVAAIDRNDIRGYFSKLGPSPYDESLIKPEISAPGVSIRSSVPGGGYQDGWSGTSMAAPHITGTAALLVSANSSLTVEEIEEIIEDTATPLTDSDYSEAPNFGYGYGLVNAFDAVSKVTTGTGTIAGKILVEGEDLSAPVIIHNQKVTEAYKGLDFSIEANISDDVAVVDAELLVKVDESPYWIIVPMERISGDHKDGVYSGTITNDIIEEPGISYKVRAIDYDGNVVVTEDYHIDIKFGILPDEYRTDFEEYPIGWILTGDWEWGEPVEGVGPRPISGSKLVGTNLSGVYSDGPDYSTKFISTLITPPIDLRDESLPMTQIRVFHWYETEKYSDKCQIKVSADYGETWTSIGLEYHGIDNPHWEEIMIDLEDYIGSETPIYIAFELSSDNSKAYNGWYLDDFKIISEDTEPPAVPTNLRYRLLFGNVALEWDPSIDFDLEGYRIYRSNKLEGEYTQIADVSSPQYIDKNVELNTTYYYKVTSYDTNQNESEFSEVLEVLNDDSVEYIYLEDFEETDGGFKPIPYGTWEWGVPTSGPNGGYFGDKVWATILDGDYPGSCYDRLETPEIILPVDNPSILSIGHWYQTEEKWDWGEVQISKKEGGTWSNWINITPGEKITGDGSKWDNLAISLAGYEGETVKVGFYFKSDWSNSGPGWYIDYVCILESTQEQTSQIKSNSTFRDDEIEPNKEQDLYEEKPLDMKLLKTTNNNYETIHDDELEGVLSKSGIPADAVVTILETGKSVRTDPVTGEFIMTHAANREGEMWTLRAEAYGHYPKEMKVNVGEDESIYNTIILEPIPQGSIKGQVLDRYYKNPAANAVIRLKEDLRIPEVVADENGYFTIENVYEGEYTLKVMADGFEAGEIKVNVVANQENEIEVPLKRFIGYSEEVGYDDGTAENALVLNASNDGLAIRVSPLEYGKVLGANIYFWGEEFPIPGGNEISIAIFDIDETGTMVQMIGKPKVINVIRGEWNYIDMSEYGFSTSRDFLISTIQTQTGLRSPATAIDESSLAPERSYIYANGGFIPLANEDVDGGLMIRANMEYPLISPVITNLKDINYVNKDTIMLEGNVAVDEKVNIYANGVKSKEVVTENKTFKVEMNLEEEETIIMTTIEINGKETEPSAPILIIKDQIAPELNIISPSNGNINSEVIHIMGNVADKYFDKLIINEEEAQVGEDGNFNHKILVDEGENVITIKATDLAGNETVVERKVYVKLDDPVIADIEPAEDTTYETGEVVKVSFMAEVDGKGYFRIAPPITMDNLNDTRIPMVESEEIPGLYEGTWTIPEGFTMINGLIEVEFIDIAGNRTTAIAPGRITVGEILDTEPMENLPTNTVIVGDEAFDIRYLNNNKDAQMKLIEWYSQGKEIYIKLGKDRIVNIRGEIVDIDELPDELTYYDAGGEVTKYIR